VTIIFYFIIHRYFELTIKLNHKKKHNFNNNKYISIVVLMK